MMSGSQTLANGFPIVIPTKTQAPTARLVLRNDLGQVVQQWLIRQNKCTLGSSTSCALRCDAPGIAPYHALLVVGARQIFIRALAPKLTRDGSPVNEVLLTDENSHFEIAGHRFELSRGATSDDQAESGPSNQRMKFTLARPFELDNRKRSEPAEKPSAASADSTEGNGKWMAQLVQAAVEPLECQIQNLLEPIAELQRESRRQREEYEQSLKTIQDSAAFDNSFPPQASIPKEQLEEISARQAASMDVISERISDVNLQLAAIERLVAEDREQATQKTDDSANDQFTEQVASQNHAIEQLQTGMVNVAGALQELESRQHSARDEDLAWKGEVQSQIAGLRVSVEELAERARNPEPVNDDSEWKSEIQQQFAQLREAVEQVVTSNRERDAALATHLEASSNQWLPAPVASFSTPTAETAGPTTAEDQASLVEAEEETPSQLEREEFAFAPEVSELPSIEDELRARLLEATQATSNEESPVDSISVDDESAGAFGLPADAPIGLDEDTDDQATNVFDSEAISPEISNPVEADTLNAIAAEAEEQDIFETGSETAHSEANEFNEDLALDPSLEAFEPGNEPVAAASETDELANQPNMFAEESVAQVEEEFFFDAANSTPDLSALASDLEAPSIGTEEAESAFEGLDGSDPFEDSPALNHSSQTEYEQDEELLGFAEASQPTFDSTALSSLETNEEVAGAPNGPEDSQEEEGDLPSWWTEDDQMEGQQQSDQFTTRDAFADVNSPQGFEIAEQEELTADPAAQQDDVVAPSFQAPADELQDDLDEFPTAGLASETAASDLEGLNGPDSDLGHEAPADLSNGLTDITDEEEFPTAAPMSAMAEESEYAVEEFPSPEEEPTTTAEFQAEVSASTEEGEDASVEDYMRKLLARMRGTPEDEVPVVPKPAPVAAPAPTPTPPPTAQVTEPSEAPLAESRPTTETFSSDGTEPFDPDKYVPRTTAPEKIRNLAAMRELANSSARTAIHKSTRQRNVASIVLKLSIAGIGFIVGGVLIAINGFQVNIGLIATVAAFLVAGIWGYDAASSLKPLLQSGLILKPQATTDNSNTKDQPAAEATVETDAPSA